MAQVSRYFPQVGLPTGPTQPQARYDTPVADTIGKIAGVTEEFAQKYQQAQYVADITKAKLDIKKQVNAYYENLRTNPIQPKPFENIIQTKENDWNEFSKKLKEEYIGKIEDPRARDYLSKEWDNLSEDNRAKIVDNALTENIAYMGEQHISDINDFVNLGEYEDAKKANAEAVMSGLWTQEKADEINDSIGVNKETETAWSKGYDEGVKYIDSLNNKYFSPTQKKESKKILASREEERLTKEKLILKEQRDQTLEDAFSDIGSGSLTDRATMEQRLAPGGKWDILDASQEQRVRTFFNTNLERLQKGSKGNSKYIENAVKSLFALYPNDRSAILGGMWDMRAQGLLGPDLYNKYYKLLDSKAFPALNEKVLKYSKEQFDALEKTGAFGDDPASIQAAKNRIFGRITDMQNDPSLTERERQQELGFTMDDAKLLFNNEREKAIGFQLDKENTLREENGQKKITDAEKLLQYAMEGKLFGIIDPKVLDRFIRDKSMTTDQVKAEVAKSYGKPYDKLSDNDKLQVDLTAQTGLLLRLTKQQFILDLHKNGQLGLDPDTWQPVITTVYRNRDGQTKPRKYKMLYDTQQQEEYWVYQDETTDGWVTSPLLSIPDLTHKSEIEKAIDTAKETLIQMANSKAPVTGESEKIKQEREAQRIKELKESDEKKGTVLGNIFRKIFGGKK